MKKYIIPMVILLLTIACHSTAVFEEYKELAEESWNKDKIIELTANIPDSGLYKLTLCLRHTSDYEMANLWCFISAHSQDVQLFKDTLNMKIANTDGRWIGKGDNIKQLEQIIRIHPFSLPKGEVIFKIEQGMRIDDMKGIKNVGIKIEKAEKQDLGTE